MIRRTIKPAEAYSRVSAEEAKAAARIVYRDLATGRLVIVENERTIRGRPEKQIKGRANPRDAATHRKGSSAHSGAERVTAKQR